MVIRCPHCQFSRSITLDKIPTTAEIATCPKCKQRFRFRTIPKKLSPELHQDTQEAPLSQDAPFADDSEHHSSDHRTSGQESSDYYASEQYSPEHDSIGSYSTGPHSAEQHSPEQQPEKPRKSPIPFLKATPKEQKTSTPKKDIWETLSSLGKLWEKEKKGQAPQADGAHPDEFHPEALHPEALHSDAFQPGTRLSAKSQSDDDALRAALTGAAADTHGNGARYPETSPHDTAGTDFPPLSGQDYRQSSSPQSHGGVTTQANLSTPENTNAHRGSDPRQHPNGASGSSAEQGENSSATRPSLRLPKDDKDVEIHIHYVDGKPASFRNPWVEKSHPEEEQEETENSHATSAPTEATESTNAAGVSPKNRPVKAKRPQKNEHPPKAERPLTPLESLVAEGQLKDQVQYEDRVQQEDEVQREDGVQYEDNLQYEGHVQYQDTMYEQPTSSVQEGSPHTAIAETSVETAENSPSIIAPDNTLDNSVDVKASMVTMAAVKIATVETAGGDAKADNVDTATQDTDNADTGNAYTGRSENIPTNNQALLSDQMSLSGQEHVLDQQPEQGAEYQPNHVLEPEKTPSQEPVAEPTPSSSVVPPVADEVTPGLPDIASQYKANKPFDYEDTTPEERVEQDLLFLQTDVDRPTKELGILREVQPETTLHPFSETREIPWEHPQTYGVFSSFIRTIKNVMFSAPAFFRTMPATGGMAFAFLFFILHGYFAVMCTTFWIILAAFLFDIPALAHIRDVVPTVALFTPVALSLLLIATTSCTRIFLILFQRPQATFAFTFKLMCYSIAPLILSIIPFIGPIAGLIWSFIILGTACHHSTGLSPTRSIITILPTCFLTLWLLFLLLM